MTSWTVLIFLVHLYKYIYIHVCMCENTHQVEEQAQQESEKNSLGSRETDVKSKSLIPAEGKGRTGQEGRGGGIKGPHGVEGGASALYQVGIMSGNQTRPRCLDTSQWISSGSYLWSGTSTSSMMES